MTFKNRILSFITLAASVSLTHALAGSGDPVASSPPDAPAEMPAHHSLNPRPDARAPIGVMGDHTHHAGRWMVSYRFMSMEMDGNCDGTSSLSPGDVFARGFMVSPLRMTMEMHMLGAMYGLTDRVTLAAMAPYTVLSMDHETRMGGRFTTESSGPGDPVFSALIALVSGISHRLHLNLGTSVPLGSIDERDTTPAGPDTVLPYPMQIGSGTWDLRPGLTYTGNNGAFSWGAQLGGVLRLGRNDEGYTLGDRGQLALWSAAKLSDWASASVRVHGQAWGDIEGRDDRLNPMAIPTARTDLRSGERVDLLFGLNLLAPAGWIRGHRLAVEAGFPIYQSLDGPQLETDWLLTAGWSFGW